MVITLIQLLLALVILSLIGYNGYRFGIKQDKFRQSPIFLSFYVLSTLSILTNIIISSYGLKHISYQNEWIPEIKFFTFNLTEQTERLAWIGEIAHCLEVSNFDNEKCAPGPGKPNW